MLTRDAGSLSIELQGRNELRSCGGIAYNKAYNISKDLFATPFKQHESFGNPQFEALGFSPKHINRWQCINRGGLSSHPHKQ